MFLLLFETIGVLCMIYISQDIHKLVKVEIQPINTHQELDTDGVIRTYSNTKDTSLLHTYETDDTQYYKGEVLYPDYVHDDTLVVVNAKDLNMLMEKYDVQSDGDINDILRVTTIKTHY